MHSIMFIHQCIFCKSSILNEHSKRDRLWISIGMRSKGISTMCSGKECIELISYIPQNALYASEYSTKVLKYILLYDIRIVFIFPFHYKNIGSVMNDESM